MKAIAGLVAALFLAGCAARGAAYQAAPAPAATDALIYIYRASSFVMGGRTAYFYVEDVNVADLDSEGYTWFHVPAGTYALKQRWPIDVSPRSLEMQQVWKAGETY